MNCTIINESPEEAFLSFKDSLMLISFTLIGYFINYIPYSYIFSVLFQLLLFGLIFHLYKGRPVVIIIACILLYLLPERIVQGFTEAGNIYTLNLKLNIAASVLFFSYDLIILKQNFKLKLLITFFVLLMIASMAWTISMQNYNSDFWWMCMAYIFFPMFIRNQDDVKLTVTAYIIAVDMFCIIKLPFFFANAGLYREWINLNPNYGAFFLMMGISCCFVLLTKYKMTISAQIKMFLWTSIVVSTLTMAFFASRSSFILLGLLLFIYLIFNLKDMRIIFLSIIIISAFYFTANQYGVFNSVVSRFELENTATAGDRLPIQTELISSILNSDPFHFFLGDGYLTANLFGQHHKQAHNAYISIFISFGFVGLLLYCCYLINIFMALHNNEYRPFLLVFLLLIGYGFALEPYHILEGVIFFCLLDSIKNLYRDEHSEDLVTYL